jgi:hypothetical protein
VIDPWKLLAIKAYFIHSFIHSYIHSFKKALADRIEHFAKALRDTRIEQPEHIALSDISTNRRTALRSTLWCSLWCDRASLWHIVAGSSCTWLHVYGLITIVFILLYRMQLTIGCTY